MTLLKQGRFTDHAAAVSCMTVQAKNMYSKICLIPFLLMLLTIHIEADTGSKTAKRSYSSSPANSHDHEDPFAFDISQLPQSAQMQIMRNLDRKELAKFSGSNRNAQDVVFGYAPGFALQTVVLDNCGTTDAQKILRTLNRDPSNLSKIFTDDMLENDTFAPETEYISNVELSDICVKSISSYCRAHQDTNAMQLSPLNFFEATLTGVQRVMQVSPCRFNIKWLMDDASGLHSLITESRVVGLIFQSDSLPLSDARELASALKDPRNVLESLTINMQRELLNGEKAAILAEALEDENCKLKSLVLYGNDIDAVGIRALSNSLKHRNNKLIHLDLGNNNLEIDDIEMISNALKHPNNKIERLDLGENELDVDAIEFLSESLKSKNCKIMQLNLSQNHLGPDGAKALSQGLKNPNNQVEFLDLSFCDLEAEGMAELKSALTDKHNQVRHLDLTDNTLLDEGIRHLAQAMASKNSKLERLVVENNPFDDESVIKDFAESISERVTHIDMGMNVLMELGVFYFAEAIKDPQKNLKYLDLSSNLITTYGIAFLADAISSPDNKLESLQIFSNAIDSNGATLLANALKNPNNKLKELNLGHNAIAETGARMIVSAIEHPSCKLDILKLYSNSLGNGGGSAFANSFASGKLRLQELYLSFNDIGNEVGDLFARTLAYRRHKLGHLNLEGNLFNDYTKQRILGTDSLTTIDL